MAKNKDITKVVYRVFGNGEVIALFPEIKETGGCILSYMHIGQHGAADRGIVANTRLATKEQAADLHKELIGIGYCLKVCKRLCR